MNKLLLLISLAVVAFAAAAQPSQITYPAPLDPKVKYWLTGMEISKPTGDKESKTVYIYDDAGMPFREERYNWNVETSKYELAQSFEYKWAENSYEYVNSNYTIGRTEKTVIEEDPQEGLSTTYRYVKESENSDWTLDSKSVYILYKGESFFRPLESWYRNEAGNLYLHGKYTYTFDDQNRLTKEMSDYYDSNGARSGGDFTEYTYDIKDCLKPTLIQRFVIDSETGETYPITKESYNYEYWPSYQDCYNDGWQPTLEQHYEYFRDINEWKTTKDEKKSLVAEGDNIYVVSIENKQWGYNNGVQANSSEYKTTLKMELINLDNNGGYYFQELLYDNFTIDVYNFQSQEVIEYEYGDYNIHQPTRKLTTRTYYSHNGSKDTRVKLEEWEINILGLWTSYLERDKESDDNSAEWTNKYRSEAEYHPDSNAMTITKSYKWSKDDNDWVLDYKNDTFDGIFVYDWDFSIPSECVRRFMYNSSEYDTPFLLKSSISTQNLLMGGYFFSPRRVDYTYGENLADITAVTADNGVSVWPRAVDDMIHIRTTDDSAINAEVYSMNGTRMMTIAEEDANLSQLSPGVYILRVNGAPFRIIKR